MKLIHIIILACLGVVIAVVLSFYGDRSYYTTFDIADEMFSKNNTRDLHVVVTLSKDKPQLYDPLIDPDYFEFYAQDSLGSERKVVFKGSKPADIERTDKIVLIGRSYGDYFMANDILKKCPSKYETDEVELTEQAL